MNPHLPPQINGHRLNLSIRLGGPPDDDWLAWQLADSAFPTGGFAHSAGLEAAWQHGEVRNSAQLTSFIEACLWQIGYGSLPFLTAAHDDPSRLDELDHLCEAFLTNHVANRASRLQGRAFLASAKRIFDVACPDLHHAHFAPAYGAVTCGLGLSRGRAGEIFFYQYLRGLIAAAVRLGIVGPMEGQSLQRHAAAEAQAVFAQCENLAVDEIAQTSPLLEIWQGAQDRLYSRLFQS